MTEELGLSYWLAHTQIDVTVVARHELEHSGKELSLRAVVDVAIEAGVGTDPAGRQQLDLTSDRLRDLALTIHLDERGLIESVSTDPDRVAPREPSVGAKVVSPSVAITCEVALADLPPLTLQQQWSRHHEQLAGHAAQIETNIERLLNNLGHFDANPVMIAQSGQALEVLQSQLGAISLAKQAWMETLAHEQERGAWQLSTADLVWVDDDVLPPRFGEANLSTSMNEMAERFDLLVAIADGQRPETHTASARSSAALVLRRRRPAQIGVYVRAEGGDWLLQDDSVLPLDVVDVYSQLDTIPLDGSWQRATSFHLAFHADMSLRTFAIANPGRTTRAARAASNGRGAELSAPAKSVARQRK